MEDLREFELLSKAMIVKLAENDVKTLLCARGWDIKVSLKSLIDAAVRGERDLKFCTSIAMDSNSCGMFCLDHLLAQARGLRAPSMPAAVIMNASIQLAMHPSIILAQDCLF